MKHTKIELSIHKKDFPEIKNAGRKVFIELFIRILSDYDRDVPFLGGTFLREHLVANQNYVDIFFILITYLSKHYKLHQRYFDLLNLVVFFQAEDGIRDWAVTGVQTCALPI